jgi:LCP family protein required for cell wall assembly
VAAVVAVAVMASGMAYARLTGNIHRVDVTAALGTDRPSPSVTGAAHAGPLNVLLLGSDTRKGIGTTEFGSDTVEGGAHSDTNLLLHLSADRRDVTVVSIPRDSMVKAPPRCDPSVPRADWVVRQWNHNFTEGGVGCTIRTLEGNTGVFVHHYAVVDFRGFRDMVDALGGVGVCTDRRIDDEDSGLHLAAGRHRLDGAQALGYVRVRKTVGDGSDLGRIGRQQAFLSSVAQEATSTSLPAATGPALPVPQLGDLLAHHRPGLRPRDDARPGRQRAGAGDGPHRDGDGADRALPRRPEPGAVDEGRGRRVGGDPRGPADRGARRRRRDGCSPRDGRARRDGCSRRDGRRERVAVVAVPVAVVAVAVVDPGPDGRPGHLLLSGPAPALPGGAVGG